MVPRVDLSRARDRLPGRPNLAAPAHAPAVRPDRGHHGGGVAGFEWVTATELFERVVEAPLAVQAGALAVGLLVTLASLAWLAGGASPGTADEYIRNFHQAGAALDAARGGAHARRRRHARFGRLARIRGAVALPGGGGRHRHPDPLVAAVLAGRLEGADGGWRRGRCCGHLQGARHRGGVRARGARSATTPPVGRSCRRWSGRRAAISRTSPSSARRHCSGSTVHRRSTSESWAEPFSWGSCAASVPGASPGWSGRRSVSPREDTRWYGSAGRPPCSSPCCSCPTP